MADCSTCTKVEQAEPVPYIVHESAMARLERMIKRLWVVLILTIILLVASNVAWMIYEVSFVEEVTETVETTTESGGNAYGTIISGKNSEVHYGYSQSDEDANASAQE